ncbi:hypothetical protein [Candidatus Viridilinea mediisalina]|uniref:Uncharacterized protein n=1 Tax=Candidatus Viridilinea mediisalina TaxID=2024553 RepID=A0A2A6RNJ8_9CHLR|nr:hypothetical protein [Candidatus Viridilinea mediisalina]PDW04495.1 hypothetical protein CJ255_02985 [Candidatus Viridilinea mediisalina]
MHGNILDDTKYVVSAKKLWAAPLGFDRLSQRRGGALAELVEAPQRRGGALAELVEAPQRRGGALVELVEAPQRRGGALAELVEAAAATPPGCRLTSALRR